MRGVSGGGKTTMARELASKYENSVIYSTDDFFMINEQYMFDAKMLFLYHKKNQERTEKAMQEKIPCIIIDNTNLRAREIKPYVKLAIEYGYEVELQQPEVVDFTELMKRQEQRICTNKALPPEIIRKMLMVFNNKINLNSIIKSIQIVDVYPKDHHPIEKK